MSKCFREYQPEQTLLLPPSLEDWLPEGHLAPVLSEVIGERNLRPIYQSSEEKDGRGLAAYEPLMMLKVLVLRLLYRNRLVAKDREGDR